MPCGLCSLIASKQSLTLIVVFSSTAASYALNVVVNVSASGESEVSQVPAGQPVPFAFTDAKYTPSGFGRMVSLPGACSASGAAPSSEDSVSEAQPIAEAAVTAQRSIVPIVDFARIFSDIAPYL